MNKITLSLLLCLLFAATVNAQAGPHRGHGEWEPPSAEDRVARLSEELQLDENQAAALLEIFVATDAERDALRKQHEEQIRQDMCAMHNNVTGQIKSVLTVQQSVEFDELMARRKADRDEHHHGHHGKGNRGPMDCDEAGA